MIKKLSLVMISLCLVACSQMPAKPSAPSVMPESSSEAYLSAPVVTFVHSADVNEFVQKMVEQYHFDPDSLSALLSQAQMDPLLISMMNHPNEKRLSWYQYRALFINPEVIKEGQDFVQQNQEAFKLAERRYGVPPGVIAGIVGVETRYGLNEGHVSALNALYTLSFAYPRRETYFQNELAQFLVLTRAANLDPVQVKSSYAGALGMPQFMPSAYRQYAVSEAKHYPDLFNNSSDVILSVGHYFAQMGWQKGEPIAVPAVSSRKTPISGALIDQSMTLAQFAQLGIVPTGLKHAARYRDQTAKLLELKGKSAPEYWLVFHNFSVIKRYNASALYAMTVFQLSALIQ